MIFSTRDWNANKSDKIRAAVQRRMNLPKPATDADISDLLDDTLRKLVKNYAVQDATTAAEAGVADI